MNKTIQNEIVAQHHLNLIVTNYDTLRQNKSLMLQGSDNVSFVLMLQFEFQGFDKMRGSIELNCLQFFFFIF